MVPAGRRGVNRVATQGQKCRKRLSDVVMNGSSLRLAQRRRLGGSGEGVTGRAAKVAGLGVGNLAGARDNRSRLQKLARGILSGCTSGGNVAWVFRTSGRRWPRAVTRRVFQRLRTGCPGCEPFNRIGRAIVSHLAARRGRANGRHSGLEVSWALIRPTGQKALARWHSTGALPSTAEQSREWEDPGLHHRATESVRTSGERLGSFSPRAQGVGGKNGSSTSRRAYAGKLSRPKTA